VPYRLRSFYTLKDGTRVYPEELAATAIYLALCVDSNPGPMKRVHGSKRWRHNAELYWKLDIYKLIETLAKHGVVSEADIDNDDLFYMVRNGYILLRKLLAKSGKRSLENLVTTIAPKTRSLLESFCKKFVVEAEPYILKEIREKYSRGGKNGGSAPS
jgi:hypothetical protein